ncbi:hypothetical protein KQH82_02960 [bacterium]|nr:hypothetical protein [bacterium]
MRFFKHHSRAIAIASVFAAVVILISGSIYFSLEQWRENVISTNTTLTRTVAERLQQASSELIDSLARADMFDRTRLTAEQSSMVDRRLMMLSDSIFEGVPGMEGGFFLAPMDDFFGYSYPTSPPPIPVYGPPPRSYTFIKNQVLESIETGHPITRVHQFDPAIFPLATQPIFTDGEIEAVVWARIHIERELPAIKLRQVINIGALTSALGFAVALLISIWQRRKILQMSQDLEQVKSGEAFEITESKGTLGFIARSINAMVRTMRADNSRREQLERELQQKQKMASLGKVIAGVAHEVKTPLAIIKTRIQIWQQALRNSTDDAPARQVFSNESLQLVVDEVDRLSDLVKRLLLFSKPQPAIHEPTDVNELLNQTVTFSETRTSKKRIEIVTELDEAMPHVAADRNALRQVFMNVLMNSIEAIQSHGRIVVRTRYDLSREHCLIEIQDNGSGIPDKLRQTVFDPFVTTKKKGFGLGLSISYEIINAHGGTIQMLPNRDKGTTCRIDLPIDQPKQDRSNEPDKTHTDRR